MPSDRQCLLGWVEAEPIFEKKEKKSGKGHWRFGVTQFRVGLLYDTPSSSNIR